MENLYNQPIGEAYPSSVSTPQTSEYLDFSNKKDEEIWEAFKIGDENAFIFIYKKYFELLYNYAHQFTKDSQVVEDNIQDLFIYIRKQRKRLGNVKSIKFYLYSSLRRRILKEQSKSRFTLLGREFGNDHDFSISVSPETLMINEQLTLDQKKFLEKALNNLSPRQREAIVYFYYEGMSYTEIATILEMKKVKYARTLVYRAIDSLKNEIENVKTLLISISIFILSSLLF